MTGMPGMGRITGPAAPIGGGQAGQAVSTGIPSRPQVPTGLPGGLPGGLPQAPGQAAQALPRGQMLLRAQLPQGFTMQPGQSMWGQVTGRQGQFYTLQFGETALSARTQIPLTMGQQIHVVFTGQSQGGQVNLQLLQTATFSRMSMADLSQALSDMKMPVNQNTLMVAKGLVEYKIPLTPQNVNDFSKALARLPGPVTQADMAAVSFLKTAGVPLTPGNITVMSNYIAQHPQLGAQLFEMQKEPQGSGGTTEKAVNKRQLEVLEEITKTTSKYIVDPAKQEPQQQAKNLRNLAREEGLEGIRYGFEGADMEEGWELMSLIRKLEGMPGGGAEEGSLPATAKSAGRNLQAHQLINQGKLQSDMAYYLLQVPFRMDDEELTAEFRIKYFEEENESKVVDPENTHIQFDVNTENLGEIHMDLKVRHGVVDLEVGAGMQGMEEFIDRHLPMLRKGFEELGYTARTLEAQYREGSGIPPLISREDFENLERINAQT